MQRVVLGSLPLWLVAVAIHSAHAFQPPLSEVDAFVVTNELSRAVRFQVTDPELDAVVQGEHSYPGNAAVYWVISSLTDSGGIVVWTAEAAGSFALPDLEVGFAVYDPNRKSWAKEIRHYEGGSGNFWSVEVLAVADGVVAWGASGGQAVGVFNAEVGYAVYDALWGSWNVGSHRYDGMSGSYWTTASLTVEGGMVAWRAVNVGGFALGHTEARYAIYDPITGSWVESSEWYSGHLNEKWTIFGLGITNQTVQWAATNRTETALERRGYDPLDQQWKRGPTVATAYFVASTSTGTTPLGVWFTDLSLGGTNWQWDFGDGVTSSLRSPYHVFERGGLFTVTQTVLGPAGTNTASLSIMVEGPSAGDLRFDLENTAVVDGAFQFRLISVPPDSSVVIMTSTDLLNWTAVYTNPPQAGPIDFIAVGATNESRRFFRAMLAD